MARPRIYVNTHGKPVKTDTGVSFNRARHRFYIILPGGGRQEFKTWDEARAALATALADSIPADELSRIAALARHRSDLAHEKLKGDERYQQWLNEPLPDSGPLVIRGGSYAQDVIRFAEAANGLADRLGVPRMTLEKALDAPASGTRLRDVIKLWEEAKLTQNRHSTQHHQTVKRYWAEFIKEVGNIFVAQLSPAHFRKFHAWTARESAKRHWSRAQYDRVRVVKSVIRYVRRKYPEWPWPNGVLEWADSCDVKSPKPRASNRQPMPVETFSALLKQCRVWASIDAQQFDAVTQSGRGKRLQAMRKRRDGVQFEAILRLGLNCGLDPVDIERIVWDDLKLDAAVPHMRFARRKVEDRVGEAVQRITPLLPSTVRAILRWKEYEQANSGSVFKTARKGRYTRNRVASTLRRLHKEANLQDTSTFKHLRNAGPTLGKRAKLSRDERDVFLGHVIDTSSADYEDEVDETYLVTLVNTIGLHYFGSERVGGDQEGTSRSAPTTEKPQTPPRP